MREEIGEHVREGVAEWREGGRKKRITNTPIPCIKP
jgi:hypothetical protein